MLAKAESPRKKKRGRKPLHPDLRALRQMKSRPSPLPPPRHHQALRPPREEPRAGVKKPLQPASFTYTGLSRSSRDEASMACQTSTSSFSQTAASKPGSLGCIWTSRSMSPHVSPQSKTSLCELKRSVSDTGGGGRDGFKGSSLKPGGVGSSGLHSSFGGGPTVQRSPLKRQEGVGGVAGLVQHKQQNSSLSKPSSSLTPRDRVNQALSLRALNLQSVSRLPAGGGSNHGHNTSAGAGAVASRASLRSGGSAAKGGVGNTKETRTSAVGQRSGLPAGGGAEQRGGKETLVGNSSGRGSASGRHDERKQGLSSRSVNELSAGDSDETSSSESEHDSSLYPGDSRPSLGNSASQLDTDTDWRPARSLLEHVFVTDVTANFITVTVKESPTSVGFFNSRNH